jgi:hypothetical protein
MYWFFYYGRCFGDVSHAPYPVPGEKMKNGKSMKRFNQVIEMQGSRQVIQPGIENTLVESVSDILPIPIVVL